MLFFLRIEPQELHMHAQAGEARQLRLDGQKRRNELLGIVDLAYGRFAGAFVAIHHRQVVLVEE